MTKALEKKVFNKIDEHFDDQLSFLADLVRCKSILLDPGKGEKEVQLTVYKKLRRMGLKVDMFEPDISKFCKHPGFSTVEWNYQDRPQVVGVLESDAGTGKSLSFVGHVDVVPAGSDKGWTYDPWKPEIVNNRMYGRGTADMKAGVSAMIYAVQAIKECDVELGGNVILMSVLEEECGGNGALSCLERGYIGDACISPEPLPAITIGSPSVIWIRMKVFGLPGHVAFSYKSVNAFDNAMKLLASLRELETEINKVENRHPAFRQHPHPFNFNLGKIHGGEWPSSLMDEVTLELRVAWNPFVKLPEGKKMLLDKLNKTIQEDEVLRLLPPEITFPGLHFDGTVMDASDPLVELLNTSHTEIYKEPAKIDITSGSSDNRFWPLYYNKPGIAYGPDGGNFHGYDEYVELESVRATTKVLAKSIMDWCK